MHLDGDLFICEQGSTLSRFLGDVMFASRLQTVPHSRVYGKGCAVSLLAIQTGLSVTYACSGEPIRRFPFRGTCSAKDLLRACGCEQGQLMLEGALLPDTYEISPRQSILHFLVVVGRPEPPPPPPKPVVLPPVPAHIQALHHFAVVTAALEQMEAALERMPGDHRAMIEVFYREAHWQPLHTVKVEGMCCRAGDLLQQGMNGTGDLTVGSLLQMRQFRPWSRHALYVHELMSSAYSLHEPLMTYLFHREGQMFVHIVVQREGRHTQIMRGWRCEQLA